MVNGEVASGQLFGAVPQPSTLHVFPPFRNSTTTHPGLLRQGTGEKNTRSRVLPVYVLRENPELFKQLAGVSGPTTDH